MLFGEVGEAELLVFFPPGIDFIDLFFARGYLLTFRMRADLPTPSSPITITVALSGMGAWVLVRKEIMRKYDPTNEYQADRSELLAGTRLNKKPRLVQ